MGLVPDRVMEQILKEAERMAGSPNYNPQPSLEQPCLYCGEPLKRGHRINEVKQTMQCPDGKTVDLTVPPPAPPLRARSIPPGPGPTAPSLRPPNSLLSPGWGGQLVQHPTSGTPYRAPRPAPPAYTDPNCKTCGHELADHHSFNPNTCFECVGDICTPKNQWKQPEPELTPLGGLGINVTASPELDKFLVAMLRSTGGTLTIYPADAELLEGETLKVERLTNPDRVVYRLTTDEHEEDRD